MKMMNRVVCSVANLFLIWLYIQPVSSQLPADQVSAMTSIYDIIQNDTAASFVWINVSRTSNPCSWMGVGCNFDNSSINTISFQLFSISTSQFLPYLCNIATLESLDVSDNQLSSIPHGFFTACGENTGLKLLNFTTNRLNGSLPAFNNGFTVLEILDFSDNSLSGEISLQLDGLDSLKILKLGLNEFTGKIPTNLGKMDVLEELDLSANSFTGEIPLEITKHMNLSVLDLSFNELSGSIPVVFGDFTNLKILDLSHNYLIGKIPSSLSNITTLQTFSAGTNRLNGEIPSGITWHLKHLFLGNNNLTGRMPSDLLSGPRLQTVDLSSNDLEGTIPAINITTLSGLTSLALGSNRLSGRLPSHLGNLTNLQLLNLESNGFVGAISPEISQMHLLEELNIGGNLLNGSIPWWISRVEKLLTLNLQGNKLGGPIPHSIANISSLQQLELGNNQLNGRIPDMPGAMLTSLNLSYNLFGGSFPASLSRLQSLQFLDMRGGNLQGPIPNSVGNLSSLIVLHLGNNQLNGRIPDRLSRLQSLRVLNLHSNNLNGVIPNSIGNLSSLTLLELGNNKLNGRIPDGLSRLQMLQVMNLQSNNLNGVIPDSITSLSSLILLHLGNNQLSGLIPDVSRLQSLQVLNLQSNNLSGVIPDHIRRLSHLVELQLGSNQLSGRIPDMPEALQTALNLSYNLLVGHIPLSLSTMLGLEVLDLSNNRLSGEIPNLLTGLGSLTQLLLMNNELSGVVPTFGSRVKVDMRGNKDLLYFRENPSLAVPIPHRKSRKSSSLIDSEVVISAASGFPVGLLISLIVIFITRRYMSINGNLSTPNSIHTPNIDFKKAMEAVADPSNITFKTTFSTFYKVAMPSGTTYLVKKINHSRNVFQLFPRHKQLVEEMEAFGSLSNSNVMVPVAYVLTLHRAYIFYDFARGTLHDVLHHKRGNKLEWRSRYSVAVGVAQGLAYLHECNSGPIILLDFCSKSILLKSLDEPQISDIELSKLIYPSKSGCYVGYVPPEFDCRNRVTAAGNVYSFGVILLELLTGKPTVSDEETELAKQALSSSNWNEILDSSIISSETPVGVRAEILTVVEVALACLSISPEIRPNTVTVVQMLLSKRSRDLSLGK